MTYAVLGTGMVGQTIAGKLSNLGHIVVVGTRNVEKTLAKSESDDRSDDSSYKTWVKNFPKVQLTTFAEASERAEIIVNATNGMNTLEALNTVGQEKLKGKILIDISNPLDFSNGMPPKLFVSNTDSLGEQIQKSFPSTKVVKTLNTVNALLMVDPKKLTTGDHTMFVCGDDPKAKSVVTELLTMGFGWKDVIDLGDISNSRGMEMLLPLWVRIWGATQNSMFGFKVVR